MNSDPCPRRCATLPLVASVALAALTLVAGCRKRSATSARYGGPTLGCESATLRAGALLDPGPLAARSEFTTVVLAGDRAFGVANFALFERAIGEEGAGATRVALEGEGERIRTVVSSGGRGAYALIDGSTVTLAKRDARTGVWSRAATLGQGPLPTLGEGRVVRNLELVPGLASHRETVVFWLGRAVQRSLDGGRSFARIELGGAVRSLTVTDNETIVALVRPEPEDEAPRPRSGGRLPAQGSLSPRTDFSLVRLAAGASVPDEVRSIAPSDPCAVGAVHHGQEGEVWLSGPRSILGVCALASRDDGRSWSGPSDQTPRMVSLGGVVLAERADAVALEAPARVPLLALPRRAMTAVMDIAPTEGEALTIAIATSEGLSLRSLAGDGAAAWVDHVLDRDRSGIAVYASAMGSLAVLFPSGLVRWVSSESGATGGVRESMSPCRYTADVDHVRASPLLALDGRGWACCASDGREGHVACAPLRDAAPRWRSLEFTHGRLYSGDGAIGFESEGARRCIVDGVVSTTDPAASLGLDGRSLVHELSCNGRGAAAVASSPLVAGVFSPFAPFDVRARRGVVLYRGRGLRHRMLLRADGSLFSVNEPSDDAVVLGRHSALGVRGASWTAGSVDDVSSIVAVDRTHAAVLAGGWLALIGPVRVQRRPLPAESRYAAVAAVGDRWMGLTLDGRFAPLEVTGCPTIARRRAP